MDSRSLPVPDGLDGVRVDAALAKLLGFSRTFAADVAEAGGVVLDGRTLGKADKLAAGGWLEVSWQARREPEIVPIAVPDLGIVYVDDDIVVVDKPAGVAAHPSVGWEGPTVLGALAAAGFRIATTGAAERQGVVHRLDVGTSGLMVVAKSERAYTALKRAFKEREVDKIYHAVVQGHPDPLAGTIDAPIGRHPTHSWKFAVTPTGKDSVTHYETLEAFPGASLLEIHLETGRTHQIRVHMAAHRHPCVGDPLYGADPTLSARLGLTRQWLHAHELSFAHPGTTDWVTFSSDYPADLAHALDVLRGDQS
ncbi:RluA family pseudouridine synthase [uncultured Microbacterium sp.]|uniref:Pseudouridine synthase n=1 Tax=uncultured Microbacterium sp. TaxID=191216 RepID=A0A1Y5P948_9MICO|nr:RluA family pseudouridine synthase [uncultured Microbacterium sp.]SBS74030.1 putative enzyme [uncultured Microbacterium sp.]